jgi:hypothetical protein
MTAASRLTHVLRETSFCTDVSQLAALGVAASGEFQPGLLVDIQVAEHETTHSAPAEQRDFGVQTLDRLNFARARWAVPESDKDGPVVSVKDVPSPFGYSASTHVDDVVLVAILDEERDSSPAAVLVSIAPRDKRISWYRDVARHLFQ